MNNIRSILIHSLAVALLSIDLPYVVGGAMAVFAFAVLLANAGAAIHTIHEGRK